MLIEAIDNERIQTGVDLRVSEAFEKACEIMNQREPAKRKKLTLNWFCHFIKRDHELCIMAPRKVEDV